MGGGRGAGPSCCPLTPAEALQHPGCQPGLPWTWLEAPAVQGGGYPAAPVCFMRFTFSQPMACSGLAVLLQDGAGPSIRTSQACSGLAVLRQDGAGPSVRTSQACSGLAVLRQDGAGPSIRTSQACSPDRNNFSLSCLKLCACSVSFSRVNCVVFF